MLIDITTHQLESWSLTCWKSQGDIYLLRRKVASIAFLRLATIPNGTITPKQPVEHLSTRRVREKLKYCKKCQKWLLPIAK